MSAADWTDEQIEASRQSVGAPADWELYTCAANCGDGVWVPPGMGDAMVFPVCSAECAASFMTHLPVVDLTSLKDLEKGEEP